MQRHEDTLITAGDHEHIPCRTFQCVLTITVECSSTKWYLSETVAMIVYYIQNNIYLISLLHSK